MPAYEIMCALIRRGVPCAVGMRVGGELSITALRSGNHYSDADACLDQELGEEVRGEEKVQS